MLAGASERVSPTAGTQRAGSTLLMHYPARWQPNVADITVDPLSTFLKDLFSAPGRMKFEEIDHIEEAWPMDQKEELRTHVLQAIETGRRMIFKWGPTSGPDSGDGHRLAARWRAAHGPHQGDVSQPRGGFRILGRGGERRRRRRHDVTLRFDAGQAALQASLRGAEPERQRRTPFTPIAPPDSFARRYGNPRAGVVVAQMTRGANQTSRGAV